MLVRAARGAGIAVVPVPGPSAVIAALSAAGLPADRFVFDGFLPVKPGRRVHRLEALRALELTVVCYESPHRILASLEAIAQVWGDAPIVVARELTKQFEEILEGPAAVLRDRFAAAPVRGEFTVVMPRAAGPPAD
jgi:16S rRNA (cytidine1402-2'-O)-methyltransferase